jgi:hypothetical protein
MHGLHFVTSLNMGKVERATSTNFVLKLTSATIFSYD